MLNKRSNISSFLFVAAFSLAITSCSDDLFSDNQDNGKETTFNFRTHLESGIDTRNISDGTNVDKLIVYVYEEGDYSAPIFTTETTLNVAESTGVDLRLITGLNYKILFWAQDADNTAYQIAQNGVITADYSNYVNGGFAKMEQLDAFYCVKEFAANNPNTNEAVSLTRPFGQVNFADNAMQPIQGSHKCIVTYNSIPTSFNSLEGSVTFNNTETAFSFTDFTDEELITSGGTNHYYYVATNYLFAPTTGQVSVNANCQIFNNAGSVISSRQIDNIPVEANKRTNICGSLIQASE